MTSKQALHSVTLWAAKLVRLDNDLGSLRNGKRVDSVIVDGHPLDVTTLAARVLGVYQEGTLVHNASVHASAQG